MRAFAYERVASPAAASQAAAAASTRGDPTEVQYLAGGTTLLDLMKLDVIRPQTVIDINPLDSTPQGRIEAGPNGLRLGALVRMADAAENQDIQDRYPVIAQSLKLAASQQIRNMASLGGNVLQRTRCSYFRNVSYADCNKRCSRASSLTNRDMTCGHSNAGSASNRNAVSSNICRPPEIGSFISSMRVSHANDAVFSTRWIDTRPVPRGLTSPADFAIRVLYLKSMGPSGDETQ
jgi:CO/xanthine dehydrogenase FAD-binding subunit